MSSNPNSGSGKLWKVRNVERESYAINSLYLDGGDESVFNSRHAGQYVMIRLPRNGDWSEPHAFTISCAPEDSVIRLTIKEVDDFTGSIPRIASGSDVKLAGPYGKFCRGIDDKKQILMIAGGVGITPFLSVLRHFTNIKADNRVTLFWVNKTMQDSFANDELRQMTRVLNLNIVHLLSREEDVEKYMDSAFSSVRSESSRLSVEILTEYSDPKSAACYLCGPPPMQESTLDNLEKLGVDRGFVEVEKFSF